MSTLDSARPPIAWPAISAAALAAAVALAATAGRYGYHRDELYFRMLRPAWGYVDQPPLTPLIARTSAAVFGDSVVSMRIPAIVAVVAAIVLIAITTRELGGGRAAQALSAWAYGFAGFPMITGHVLLTATVDLVLWTAVLLAVTRALLRDDQRWWLVAGALVGVSLYNKLLITMLLLGLAAGLLIIGPRQVLRSRWLWGGVAIAVVVGAPNLIYQATHHFPQLTMAGALAGNNAGEVRAELLPFQLLLVGPLLVPICVAGFVALLRRPAWRPLRAIAVAYLAAVVLTFAGGGQVYYGFGLLAFLLAAGCVPTVDWIARGRASLRAGLVVAAVALNAAQTVLIALPVLPVTTFGRTALPALNQAARDQVGWPVYVRTLADVYSGLSARDRSHTVLIGDDYGEAGALARYGRGYGLPAVYSGQNQLWFYGPPPESATVAVIWTEYPPAFSSRFASCQQRAVMDDGVGVDNEEQGSAVLVCRDPIGGWATAWPHIQHYD